MSLTCPSLAILAVVTALGCTAQGESQTAAREPAAAERNASSEPAQPQKPLVREATEKSKPQEPNTDEASPASAPRPTGLHRALVKGETISVWIPVLEHEDATWNAATDRDDFERIAVDDPGVPERLQRATQFTIVTSAGAARADELLGVSTEGGASDMWWKLVFQGAGVEPGVALALANGEVASDASLERPKRLRLDSDRGAKILAGIRETLDRDLSKPDRRRMGKKRLTGKRISILPGDFPGAGVAAVAINVPIKSDDPGAVISALLVVDEVGHPTVSIQPPKLRLERYDIDYLVDLVGDGADAIAYTSAYYEGAYEFLSRYDGQGYADELLAGDGA